MEENKVKPIEVPDQIVLDFKRSKLKQMRSKLKKLINDQNEKRLVSVGTATGFVAELLQREIERKLGKENKE